MSTIASAKKLLVVPNPKLKPGEYLPFTVLLEVLNKNVEKIDLCLPQSFDSKLTAAAKLPEVNIIKSVSPRRFVLTFNKGDDQVKNIQWQQSDEKISVYISMDKGQFDTGGMKMKAEGGEYDTILFYGVTDYSQVEGVFKNFPALVHEAKNVSIGGAFAIPHGKVELNRGEQGETIAELVYSEISGKGATPEHYSRLLSSVFLTTRRFANPNTRPKTFKSCAEFISNGANLGRANSIADQLKSEGSKEKTKPDKPKTNGDQNSRPKQNSGNQNNSGNQPQPAKQIDNSQNRNEQQGSRNN